MAALVVCGCGTTVQYTALQRAPRELYKRPAHEVDVFLSGPPKRPHRDIGLFEAQQTTELSLHETREMLHELRRAAGERGCDAIHVMGVGAKGQTSIALELNGASVKTITATCLVYDEDSES
jgi:hypothetical protein